MPPPFVLPLDLAMGKTVASEDGVPFDFNNLLSAAPELRWGVCGTGRICNDFVQVRETSQE